MRSLFAMASAAAVTLYECAAAALLGTVLFSISAAYAACKMLFRAPFARGRMVHGALQKSGWSLRLVASSLSTLGSSFGEKAKSKGKVEEELWVREQEQMFRDKKKALPRRVLDAGDVESWERDGFLRVKNFFTKEETSLLLETIEADSTIGAQAMPMKDNDGKSSKLTLWFHLGSDTYSAFARSTSLMAAAETLLKDKPYMFHTKIMLKEPRVGGSWEWHQDFGYWYAQGLLHPDKCMSCILAVDDHTVENGCLQVLRGSHKLGRVEHGIFGEQAGADPSKVSAAQHNQGMELVHCELDAGDMLFTHSNLLHASAPNNSDGWRRSMIVAYNGCSNQPLVSDGIIPPYSPPEILPDGDLASYGVVPHSSDRKDFLSAEKNVASFDTDDVKIQSGN